MRGAALSLASLTLFLAAQTAHADERWDLDHVICDPENGLFVMDYRLLKDPDTIEYLGWNNNTAEYAGYLEGRWGVVIDSVVDKRTGVDDVKVTNVQRVMLRCNLPQFVGPVTIERIGFIASLRGELSGRWGAQYLVKFGERSQVWPDPKTRLLRRQLDSYRVGPTIMPLADKIIVSGHMATICDDRVCVSVPVVNPSKPMSQDWPPRP